MGESDVLEVLRVILRGDDAQYKRVLREAVRESADTKKAVSRNLDFGSIGANLGGLTGGGGILYVLREFAGESARAKGEAQSFINTLERAGIDRSGITKDLGETADRVGLLREQLEGAATPLLKMGVDAETVDKTLLGLASSAGIAGKSGQELADAVAQGAVGIAQGRSELLETASVLVNASQAQKTYADSIGVSVSALSDQQKALAYAQAVINETKPDVEDFADTYTEFAESQAAAGRESDTFRKKVGAIAQEGLIPLNNAVADTLGFFNDLPEPLQRVTVGATAAGAGAAALAGGLALLTPILGVLSGPAGLFLLVAAGIGAVAGALSELDRQAVSPGGKLEALGDKAEETASKIGTASDKAGLRGALVELAETADGEAKERLQSLIDKLDDAGTKFDEIKGKAAELTQELALAPLQAEKAALQTQLNLSKQNEGGQSVDVLTSDYEDRLTRELGLKVDIEVVKGDDGQYIARFAESMGQVRLNAEDTETALRALSDITTTANAQTGSLSEEQRTLQERLAAVNKEIDARQNKTLSNTPASDPSPTGTSSADTFSLLNPGAEAFTGDLRNIPNPQVEVEVTGQPVDIFGVTFDPATGVTSEGAAPTARVTAEVEVEIPDAYADVIAGRDIRIKAYVDVVEGKPLITSPDFSGQRPFADVRDPVDLLTSPEYTGRNPYAAVASPVALLNSPDFTGPNVGLELDEGAIAIREAGAVFNDAVLQAGVGFANALADGKIDSNEASGIGGALGSAGGALAAGALGLPPQVGSVIGGLFGSLVGGLFGGSSEEDSRSRAVKDAERRGGASQITFNAFVNQQNTFQGGIAEPQVQTALDRQVRRILSEMLSQVNFDELKKPSTV